MDAIQKFYPAYPSFSLPPGNRNRLSSSLNPRLAAILPVFSCEHLFWKKMSIGRHIGGSFSPLSTKLAFYNEQKAVTVYFSNILYNSRMILYLGFAEWN